MLSLRSFCILLTSVSLYLAISPLCPTLDAAPDTAKQQTNGKQQKQDQPTQQTQTSRKRATIILPVRYIRGSRMVRLLRMFIPRRDYRHTTLLYSPALHQILIRGTRDVLQTLKRAHEQLDVPQAQFRVQVYFVKVTKERKDRQLEQEYPALYRYLSRAYPLKREFSLAGFAYVHATNHEEAQLKVTHRSRVSDPSIKLVLHQASGADDLISLGLKIAHHESFRSVSKKGTNTQFITSVSLQTRMVVKPGALTLVGHTPWKGVTHGDVQALVVVKVERLNDAQTTQTPSTQGSLATKAAKPTARSWGRHSIRQVIRENRTHFKQCYEQALKAQPKLQGRIVVSFTIDRQGKTTGVRLKQSTLQQEQVERCILGHFQKLQFPAPPGGGVVRVNYPLTFHP